MNKVHKIDSAVFFGPASAWDGFRDIQLGAIQSGLALEASMQSDHVRLALVERPNNSEIEILGNWRSPDFGAADMKCVAVKLMMPFLFRTSAVTLPVDQIFTYGKSYRSIADFFMRNVFLGACRNTPIACVAQTIAGDREDGTRKLQRQYFTLHAK